MPQCGISFRWRLVPVITSKNRTSFRRETTMALSQRLEFRQSQALVMTPQLMQAIKLLQLSSLDLAAYVEGELEKNPLLERACDDENSTPGNEPEAAAAERDEDQGGAPDWNNENLETSRASMEQGL